MEVSWGRASAGLGLNGEAATAEVRPGDRLSHVLRKRLGARDVKVGYNAGDCRVRPVLVDGAPVRACFMLAQRVAGEEVETLAELRFKPKGEALAVSFSAHQAVQCGICTPGMMVAAVALLRQVPKPTEAQA